MEKELGKKKSIGTVEIKDERMNKVKSTDVLELEKEIATLEEKLLPRQNLKSAAELPTGEEKRLATGDNLEMELLYEEMSKREREKEIRNKEIRNKEIEKLKKEGFGKEVDYHKLLIKEEQKKKSISKKEFVKPKEKGQPKEKLGLGWYVQLIKRPVMYLFAVELLIYFFSSVNYFENFMKNIIWPLTLILDAVVFIWLAAYVKRIIGQNSWVVIKTCFLAGWLIGWARAIVKLFWLIEDWTVVNLFIEPIIVGLMAAGIGLLVAWVIKKRAVGIEYGRI